MTSKKEKRQAVFDDDLPLSLYKTNSNLSFQKGKGAIDYFLASIWCPNFTACATVAATKATTTNVNITKLTRGFGHFTAGDRLRLGEAALHIGFCCHPARLQKVHEHEAFGGGSG